jgi:hypothetical protein
MDDPKLKETMDTWLRSGRDLTRALNSEETTEKDRGITVNTLMGVARNVIEAITEHNEHGDGGLSPDQIEWIAEFSLGLLRRVSPVFAQIAVTLVRGSQDELSAAMASLIGAGKVELKAPREPN